MTVEGNYVIFFFVFVLRYFCLCILDWCLLFPLNIHHFCFLCAIFFFICLFVCVFHCVLFKHHIFFIPAICKMFCILINTYLFYLWVKCLCMHAIILLINIIYSQGATILNTLCDINVCCCYSQHYQAMIMVSKCKVPPITAWGCDTATMTVVVTDPSQHSLLRQERTTGRSTLPSTACLPLPPPLSEMPWVLSTAQIPRPGQRDIHPLPAALCLSWRQHRPRSISLIPSLQPALAAVSLLYPPSSWVCWVLCLFVFFFLFLSA